MIISLHFENHVVLNKLRIKTILDVNQDDFHFYSLSVITLNNGNLFEYNFVCIYENDFYLTYKHHYVSDYIFK